MLDKLRAALAAPAVAPKPRCNNRSKHSFWPCDLPLGHDGEHQITTITYWGGGVSKPVAEPVEEAPKPTCEHGATMRHQFRMYGISDDWWDCPGPVPVQPTGKDTE